MTAKTQTFLSIKAGELVRSDGKTWKVKSVVSVDSVLATELETETIKVLRVATISAVPRGEESPPPLGRPALDDYSPEEWAAAQRRLAIIRPYLDNPRRKRKDAEALANQHGIGATTIYRWVRAYENSEQLAALVADKRGRPKGMKFLAADQEAIIEAAIKDRYLTKRRATEKEVIECVEHMCRKAGIRAPNHNTIRARIHEIPKALALRRRGRPDLARGRYEALKGEFPGADYPLAVVQIDHTPGNVMLVDELTRESLGRPNITLAIDVYSRMIVGLQVSLDPPSVRTVGACIAQAICPKDDYLARLGVTGEWPVWGVPSSIHSDNAKEFLSKSLCRACENYSIDVQRRPKGLPEYGGHVERMMLNVATELAKIPGKTFANTAEKTGYDPEGEAVMTLREFEAYLVDDIINRYHMSAHTAIGTTPMMMWKRGIEGSGDVPGRGLPPLPTNPERIRMDFLPTFERTIQRYGVLKDHVHYYDPVLDPYINDEDANSRSARMHTFRYDPTDISRIFFLDPATNDYVPIPYRELSRPVISEWEQRRAIADLRAQGRKDIDEDALFSTNERLRGRIDESIAKTKAARRAKARRPEAAIAELPDPPKSHSLHTPPAVAIRPSRIVPTPVDPDDDEVQIYDVEYNR